MNETDHFRELLRCATAEMEAEYLQLPVAEKEERIYRERIYCYELYHQLRNLWPESLSDYSLAGEVDKAGHPLIRNNQLDWVKPDLLVHVPGNMENNLVVLELKPLNGERKGFAKDLRTLTAFRRRASYAQAIHLTYSCEPGHDGEIVSKAHQLQREDPSRISLDEIEVWYHPGSGSEALRL